MLYNSIIVLVYRYKGEDYMKTVKIGLLGIGNVGSGAFQIFSLNSASIAKASGCEITVSGVLARSKNKKRDIDINPEIITDDPDEIKIRKSTLSLRLLAASNRLQLLCSAL